MEENITRESLAEDIIAYFEKKARSRTIDETQKQALVTVKKAFKYFTDITVVNDVKRNESCLFGYAYFVGNGKNFEYNQSYLDAKINDYSDFLKKYKKHIDFIIEQTNKIINHKSLKTKIRKYHLVFDELIVLSYNEDEKKWLSKMRWGNFSSIVEWKESSCIFQIEDKSKVVLYTFEILKNNNLEEIKNMLEYIKL